MLTKITHITLFVHDQDKALDFYTKVGFKLHTDAMFGTMRWLTMNLPEQKDTELVFILAENEQEKALVGKQTVGKPFISFESTDCQKDYERLKAAGVQFDQEPQKHGWGIAVGFADLYGNYLYMCQTVNQ